MNIRIGKYEITSDNLQFILNEVCERGEKASKPGETYLSPIGYYTEPEHLITAIFRKEILKSEAESLKQLSCDLQLAYDFIKDVAMKLKQAGLRLSNPKEEE